MERVRVSGQNLVLEWVWRAKHPLDPLDEIAVFKVDKLKTVVTRYLSGSVGTAQAGEYEQTQTRQLFWMYCSALETCTEFQPCGTVDCKRDCHVAQPTPQGFASFNVQIESGGEGTYVMFLLSEKSTLNPKPSTLNPKPQTLNSPRTLNPPNTQT